jgi:hypothetical protein
MHFAFKFGMLIKPNIHVFSYTVNPEIITALTKLDDYRNSSPLNSIK